MFKKRPTERSRIIASITLLELIKRQLDIKSELQKRQLDTSKDMEKILKGVVQAQTQLILHLHVMEKVPIEQITKEMAILIKETHNNQDD